METHPPDSDPSVIDSSPGVIETGLSEATPGAATSYWRLETAGPVGRSRRSRIVDAVLALAALCALYVLGAVGVAGRPLTDPERLGYQAAIVIAGVAIGLGARWLYRRNRDAGGPLTRLFSPWLLLGAFVMLLPTLGEIASRTPADPTTALRISASYSLTEVEPEILSQIQAEYTEGVRRGLGPMTIRQVDGEDGSRSYLMVFDGAFPPDADLSEIASGIGDAAGGEPILGSINGRPVAFVTTPAQSLVSWVESPFEIMVLGADEATARDVAAAVLAAPSP